MQLKPRAVGQTRSVVPNMTAPSKLNEAQVRALFAEGEVSEAIQLLSEQSPGVGHASLLERIRSAAVRVSGGDLMELRRALALAATDWRDLLVAAGFANDVNAHLR